MDITPISTLYKGAGANMALGDQNDATAINAVKSFTEALQRAENEARAAVTTGSDPHELVAALSESRLAVETVVAVRDKVVEAYQEILRMQV